VRRTIWASVSLPGPSKASNTSDTLSMTALGVVGSTVTLMTAPCDGYI
jgi:hypothetical protein